MVFLLFARSIGTYPKGREGGCYGTQIEMMPAGRRDGSSSPFCGLGGLQSRGFTSSMGECLSEARCAEHFDDAFEVVSHDGDADFSLSTCEAPQQQARVAEDAIFDGSEGMFNRRSS